MNPDHLYKAACERTGLDPDGRFLYVARDRGQFRVELTIDGFRLTAERTGKYKGQIGPQWCGPDGQWLDIWTGDNPPHAARVGILRDGFAKPIWGKAIYTEFVQDSEFWRKMPANQLAKCAEAAGFRKAFPAEFSGLYSPDELPPAVAHKHTAQAEEMATAPRPRLCNQTANERSTGFGIGLPSDQAAPLRPVMPERGDAASAIPAPLQPFVDGGMSRRNIQACWEFLRNEFEAAGLPRQAFQKIYLRVPGVFKTREEARSRTIAAWVECWDALEAAKRGREAA